jgi:hypothetical protein
MPFRSALAPAAMGESTACRSHAHGVAGGRFALRPPSGFLIPGRRLDVEECHPRVEEYARYEELHEDEGEPYVGRRDRADRDGE